MSEVAAVARAPDGGPLLTFERVALRGGTFQHSFGVGVHTVTGDRDSGAFDLFQLASGALTPRRGRVLLAGGPLCRSPRLRRRVAVSPPSGLPRFQTLHELVRETAAVYGYSPDAVWERLETWHVDISSNENPGGLSPETTASVQLALALAHESADVVLLWNPFATKLEPEWLRKVVCASALERVVIVFASVSFEPPLPGSVVHFGAGSTQGAPRPRPVPRRGSLWVGAEPVETLARELLGHPGIVGAEILLGQPGLLCLGIALQPESAVAEVCARVLSVACLNGVRVDGIRYEAEASP